MGMDRGWVSGWGYIKIAGMRLDQDEVLGWGWIKDTCWDEDKARVGAGMGYRDRAHQGWVPEWGWVPLDVFRLEGRWGQPGMELGQPGMELGHWAE